MSQFNSDARNEKIFIDNSRVIEFVCETANKVVLAKFGPTSVYFQDGDEGGELKYTEEAQDYFNEVYDDIEGDLNTILGVHSTNDLEVVE